MKSIARVLVTKEAKKVIANFAEKAAQIKAKGKRQKWNSNGTTKKLN